MTRPLTTAHAVTRPLLLLLSLAALLAFFISRHEPVSVPMPEYLADAQQWASAPGERMTDTFTPLAYPLFIAPALHYVGPRSVIALQAALYLATVATAFGLLLALELTPLLAALGSLPILFYPDFFESIPKIWDVGLSALLFLLLVFLLVNLQRRGPNTPRALLLGAVFAAALFCRPNLALIAPLLLYAIWTHRPRPGPLRIPYTIAFAAIATVLVYAGLGIAAYGKPFLPTNGPYNLYVGNNDFTARAMLLKLNGEPSLYPAMRAHHPELTPSDAGPEFFHESALQSLYTHDATVYLVHHPAEEVRLVALKFLTFFRPDTKVHSLSSKAGLVKAVLALPILLFAGALLLSLRRLTSVDYLLLGIDAAYLLPFLLTNSDPRFRAPLDALLLLHTVRLLALRFRPPSFLPG